MFQLERLQALERLIGLKSPLNRVQFGFVQLQFRWCSVSLGRVTVETNSLTVLQTNPPFLTLSTTLSTPFTPSFRPSALLQPTQQWTGHRFFGWRMANCSRKHQHVSIATRRIATISTTTTTTKHLVRFYSNLVHQRFIREISHIRFTYEIAPVFILMEHFVLEKMRHIIGFYDGDSILAPGGAVSNLYSIIVARHKMFPEYKSRGMRGLSKQPVIFTSEHVSKVE